ncbi:MAG: nicotinate-nucleotide adenylyltransferase [Acidocella sp.]|nr:nicotinate-nucleotide adenylyltransferase [Acidocella sp.]
MIPTYGHHYRLRVGLLGGSFNPAHGGHMHVARQAMRHLRLDQIWLMVSPGNPLKPRAGMAPFIARLASARRVADGRRVIATDIELRLGTQVTAETMRGLKQRFARVRFVWLMGADNLRQLPRWGHWLAVMHAMPMLVLPRPGATRAAISGQAAARFSQYRLKPRCGLCLATAKPPAWVLLPGRENSLSATALRQSGLRQSIEGALS